MNKISVKPATTDNRLAPLPGWIERGKSGNLVDAGFSSGAALAHLYQVAASELVPHPLWRARLALMAAETCAGLAGRPERAADLRDALHLLRPGDHPGPAGDIFRQWSDVVTRPMSMARLGKSLSGLTSDEIDACLGEGISGTPIDRAAAVLGAALAHNPRAATAGLALADATLARALGWEHLVPLLAVALHPRDMRKQGDELRLACHQAGVKAAGLAVGLAAELARRASKMQAIAPKLRAKGAERAVALFLSRDALAPSALTGIMSDRAARRLCDRLVALGAVRELTGRESFRLYGV